MPLVFKTPNGPFPPGGYAFSDPHTAMAFSGEGVDLNSQILRVIEHRKGNPKIYSPDKPDNFNPDIIRQQIIEQVCSHNPTFCEDSARPGLPWPPIPEPAKAEVYTRYGKVCPRCQCQEFTPVRCKTCGGSRISSYKCNNCGYDT